MWVLSSAQEYVLMPRFLSSVSISACQLFVFARSRSLVSGYAIRNKSIPLQIALSSNTLQHVGHRVKARLRVRDEPCGPEGAVGEGAAGEGPVDDLDLLSARVEDEPVFADHRAAAQGVDTDLTLLAGR